MELEKQLRDIVRDELKKAGCDLVLIQEQINTDTFT